MFYCLCIIVIICSCVVWHGDFLIFGSETGELHVWKSDMFNEVVRIKGHSGKFSIINNMVQINHLPLYIIYI